MLVEHTYIYYVNEFTRAFVYIDAKLTDIVIA